MEEEASQWEGTVIDGRYRLEGFLGAGGMASVHRGIDLESGRAVAVKVLRPGVERRAGVQRNRRGCRYRRQHRVALLHRERR